MKETSQKKMLPMELKLTLVATLWCHSRSSSCLQSGAGVHERRESTQNARLHEGLADFKGSAFKGYCSQG